MKKIKVRFNLGLGKNYMKWKIDIPGEKAMYLHPHMVQLRMTRCTLRNSPATAAKIYAGAHKTVCAWILCDQLEIIDPGQYPAAGTTQLSYNPRTQPNWMAGAAIVDNGTFESITTEGRKLFTNIS